MAKSKKIDYGFLGAPSLAEPGDYQAAPAQAAPAEDQGRLADYGIGLMKGFANVAQSLGGLAGLAGRAVGIEDDPTRGWYDEAANFANYKFQSLKSKRVQEQEAGLSNVLANKDLGTLDTMKYLVQNPGLVTQMGVESVPSMMASMTGVGAVSRIGAVGRVLQGSKYAAGLLGGASEGALMAGDVYNTTQDVKASLGAFALGTVTGLTPGNLVGSVAKKRLGVSLAEEGVENIFNRTAARRALGAAVGEGGQEFIQEGGQALLEQAGKGQPLDTDVALKRGAVGAAVGAAMGVSLHPVVGEGAPHYKTIEERDAALAPTPETPSAAPEAAEGQELFKARIRAQEAAAAAARDPGNPGLQQAAQFRGAEVDRLEAVQRGQQASAAAALNPGDPGLQQAATSAAANTAAVTMSPGERGEVADQAHQEGQLALVAAPTVDDAISQFQRNNTNSSVLRTGAQMAQEAHASMKQQLVSEVQAALVPEVQASFNPETAEIGKVAAAPVTELLAPPSMAAQEAAPAPQVQTPGARVTELLQQPDLGISKRHRTALEALSQMNLETAPTTEIARHVETLQDFDHGKLGDATASQNLIRAAQEESGAHLPYAPKAGSTVQAALQEISQSGSKPGRALAQVMLDRMTRDKHPALGLQFGEYDGAADARGMVRVDRDSRMPNAIAMNPQRSTEGATLHEIAHAGTLSWLNRADEGDHLYQELRNIYQRAKEAAVSKGESHYALADHGHERANLAEFIGEAMSRPAFQDFLRTVPAGKTSAWGRMVQFVADALRIGKGYDSALGDVLQATTRMISAASKVETTEAGVAKAAKVAKTKAPAKPKTVKEIATEAGADLKAVGEDAGAKLKEIATMPTPALEQYAKTGKGPARRKLAKAIVEAPDVVAARSDALEIANGVRRTVIPAERGGGADFFDTVHEPADESALVTQEAKAEAQPKRKGRRKTDESYSRDVSPDAFEEVEDGSFSNDRFTLKPGYENGPMRGYVIEGDNGERLGYVVMRMGDEGFNALANIEIKESEQGKGTGEAVVRGLIGMNPDRPLGILDIQQSAVPFWRKLGTQFQSYSSDPNVQMDGTLSQGDYEAARQEGRQTAGRPGREVEAGRGSSGVQRTAEEIEAERWLAEFNEGVKDDSLGTFYSRDTAPSQPAVTNQPEVRATISQVPVTPASQNEVRIINARGQDMLERVSNTVRKAFQDKHVTLGRVLRALKHTGTLESLDRFDGLRQSHVETLVETPLRQIENVLTGGDRTREQFEEFLRMSHARDYNAHIARINPYQETIDPATGQMTARGYDMEAHPGSGIPTSRADAYMRSDAAADPVLRQAAGIYRQMIAGMQDYAVARGLEEQGTINAWREQFPNYTPFRRVLDADENVGTGTGTGFSVRHGISREAMGSSAEIASPLAATLQQGFSIINRGEKARVAQALLDTARTAPVPMYRTRGGEYRPMWRVDTAPNIRTVQQVAVYQILDPSGTPVLNGGGIPVEFYNQGDAEAFRRTQPAGTIVQEMGVQPRVVVRHNPSYVNRDNVLIVPESGQNTVLVFDEQSEDAMDMARNMKNLDSAQLNNIAKVFNVFSRWVVGTSTGYNPFFGLFNFVRDIQSAAVNIASDKIPGWSKGDSLAMVKDAGSNIAPLLRHLLAEHNALRGRGDAPVAQPGSAADWMERARAAGGLTGINRSVSDFGDALNRIEQLFGEPLTAETDPRQRQDMLFKAGERAEALRMRTGEILNDDLRTNNRAARFALAIPSMISNWNESLEMATRVAAFKGAYEKYTDAGMALHEAEAQAALVSKNVSINFNRRGTHSTMMNALFPFFNAAAQGSARLAELIFEKHQVTDPATGEVEEKTRLSSAGKKVLLAMPLLGAAQAILLAAAGFKDDEPPDFVKQRSLIIPTGNGGYVSWPLPLGLNSLFNVGREAMDAVIHPDTIGTRAKNIVSEPFTAFNPLGSTPNAVLNFTPAVADIPVALYMNEDAFGRPIAKQDFNPRKPTPGFTRTRPGTSQMASQVAEVINTLSGGNEYKRGMFSPTGDQVQYLAEQIAGGVGREVTRTAALAGPKTGETPWYKVPVVGKLYGDVNEPQAQQSRLFAISTELNQLSEEYKGLLEDGRREEAAKLLREHPEITKAATINRYFTQDAKMRRSRADLLSEGKTEAASKLEARANEKATRLMQEIERAKAGVK